MLLYHPGQLLTIGHTIDHGDETYWASSLDGGTDILLNTGTIVLFVREANNTERDLLATYSSVAWTNANAGILVVLHEETLVVVSSKITRLHGWNTPQITQPIP